MLIILPAAVPRGRSALERERPSHALFFRRAQIFFWMVKMFLLHTHGGEGIAAFLDEVLLHGVADTLKLVPFLFLTYLLMEFIEHKASDKAAAFMQRAGRLGPVIGGALGAVPQCGFSAAAANLYTGRVITLGTLIAVFLSTSDEMIPILIAGDFGVLEVVFIVLYKVAVGILVGFAVDLALRLFHKEREDINIDEICERDECHCERGIFYSAAHHALTISLFVLIVTLLINAAVFFIGEETLGAAVSSVPVVSHIAAAIVGLIPNCAASVLLATLCSDGIISVGVMLSGLFSGAGVGLLVLTRVNKRPLECAVIALILVLSGVLFGLLSEIIFVL